VRTGWEASKRCANRRLQKGAESVVAGKITVALDAAPVQT